IIQEVADEHVWEIVRLAIQPDHVHLFIEIAARRPPPSGVGRKRRSSFHAFMLSCSPLASSARLWHKRERARGIPRATRLERVIAGAAAARLGSWWVPLAR